MKGPMRTHRPCLTLALITIAGILTGQWVSLPSWVWLLGAALTAALHIPFRWAACLFLALFCLSAFWRTAHNDVPRNSIAFLYYDERRSVTAVEGVVDESPRSRNGRTVFALDVRYLYINESKRAVSGKILIDAVLDSVPMYGDLCRFTGKIIPIPEFEGSQFSYRRYMRERGVYGMMRPAKALHYERIAAGQGHPAKAWALTLHQKVVHVLRRYLTQPEAALTAALVVGEDNTMPKDMKEVFINTGTAHILAVSGMNMAVMAAVFFFCLRLTGLPRPLQFWGTIVLLWGYAVVSGWAPSVVRACVMASVILAGFALEEEWEPLNSLGFAALILLAFNPLTINDIGFQLSFAAVSAILIAFGPLMNVLKKVPQWLAALISVSTAAWAGTAPITYYHFQTFTPIAIVANIPIVPMADFIMVLGLGLSITGSICPTIAYAFAGALKAIISALVILATWFSSLTAP